MIAQVLKKVLPARAVSEIQHLLHRRRHTPAARVGTAEAFSRVYATKAWGDDGSDFYSGPGSVDVAVTEPYLGFLRSEFARMPKPPHVLDLGCGDFKIGAGIAEMASSYVGIDVVPDLIARNRQRFQNDRVTFLCGDVSRDDLPAADVVLIREVLQHMSNDQISRVIRRLAAYPVAYVTNVEPAKNSVARPNRDLVPGPDTRSVFGSALFLDEPPFNIGGQVVLDPVTHQATAAEFRIVTRKLTHGH